MSKKPLRSEGREREEWEYPVWAAAVLRDEEDIRHSFTEEAWKEHYRSKYPQNLSKWGDRSESQLNALYRKGITGIRESLPKVGLIATEVRTYRDTRGRFVDKAFAEANPLSVKATSVNVFQNIRTGQIISFQDVALKIRGLPQ